MHPGEWRCEYCKYLVSSRVGARHKRVSGAAGRHCATPCGAWDPQGAEAPSWSPALGANELPEAALLLCERSVEGPPRNLPGARRPPAPLAPSRELYCHCQSGCPPGGPQAVPSPGGGRRRREGGGGRRARREAGRGYRLVGEQWRSPRLPGRAEPGLEPGALAPSAVLAPGFAGWRRRELSPPLSPAAAPSLPGPRQVPSESPAFLRDAHAPPRASAGRPLSRKPLLSSTHLTPRKRLRAGGRHGGARGNQATDDNRQRLPRPSALAPYTMCTLQAHVAARPAAALGLRRESRVTPSPGLQAALSSLCAAAATPASAAGTRTRGGSQLAALVTASASQHFLPASDIPSAPDVPSHRRHSL